VNYHVPFLRMIREPSRHLVVYLFAFSALSGFGFEVLRELAVRSAWLRRPSHYFVLGAYVLLLLRAYAVRRHYQVALIDDRLTLGLFVGFQVLLIIASLTSIGRFRVAWGILAVVAITPSLLLPILSSAPLEIIDLFDEPNLKSHEVLQQVARLTDVANCRVSFHDDKLHVQSWSMNGCYYGIRSFSGCLSPLVAAHFHDSLLAIGNPPVGQLWGGKYSVWNASGPQPEPPHRLIGECAGYKIYEATNALPRAALANHVLGAYQTVDEFRSQVAAAPTFTSGVFVPAGAASHFQSFLGAQSAVVSGRLTEVARSHNTATYFVANDQPSLFVFNEYNCGAWKVFVDGKSRASLVVNWNRLGVALTPGKHIVELRYEPRVMRWLLMCQTWFAGGLATLLVVRLVARRFQQVVLTSKESALAPIILRAAYYDPRSGVSSHIRRL